ncbi:amidohydrolase family protein [Pseudofrankia inefficax]|uniref:Amidohydrolase 2 n=1 Tax=Pseudofrankia inefficax (strain DSM 45817 / CECT 9037 / DDB 130130 / EuI1c) TaxID=298654 RepID=E3J7S2_PSEI1|nr:amidohydrolase 2 [Pseudofrankia inefficax]
MNLDDLILVSVDDHVIEPPNLFEGRLSAKYQDKAPRLIERADGAMAWVYEGIEIPNVALNAVAGRPREELGFEPASLAQLRPGCYDVHSRVRDMDANGVLGSMSFPSFVRFCGQLFMNTPDREQAAAMVRAYNDWHIDDWAGSYPGRFIPLALPMLWDAEATAAEVRRVAAKGCHALTFSSNPFALGLPSIHTDYWDPVWKACVETGTVVCMHLGSSSQSPTTSPDAPIEVLYSLSPINLFEAAADVLWSPMFRKFPELRVALSEGGTGWVPYFLERVDYIYNHTRPWTKTDLGGRLPSEIFNEHVISCFIDDAVGIETRAHLNIDNVMWECDYPHSDTTWPHSPELVDKRLAGVPDADINKITHLNAIRHFQYDPFAHIPRELATVGALRRRAEGWDISPKPAAQRAAESAGTWRSLLSRG